MHNAIRERERDLCYARLIELETRNYYHTRRELMRLAQENTVQVSVATRLHMERTVHAINSALDDIARKHDGANRLRMIELKYWDGRLTDEGIMLQIPIGRTTFYKWRREYLQSVAGYLGYDMQ